MKNSVIGYQRSAGAPWMAVPSNIAQRSLRLFIAVGTWHALRYEDGTVKVR